MTFGEGLLKGPLRLCVVEKKRLEISTTPVKQHDGSEGTLSQPPCEPMCSLYTCCSVCLRFFDSTIRLFYSYFVSALNCEIFKDITKK